jgi:hypothetical protein
MIDPGRNDVLRVHRVHRHVGLACHVRPEEAGRAIGQRVGIGQQNQRAGRVAAEKASIFKGFQAQS